MVFTVINLSDTLGNVRPFIIRSQASLYGTNFVGRFGGGKSRFADWYDGQTEWVICAIIEYPDRHAFETGFGW